MREWVSARPAYGVTETKAAKRAKTEPAPPEPSMAVDEPAEGSTAEGAGA
ncbi:hypothetical protein BH23CHL7_BH23CHL7_23930 [soil metagenome]